MKIPKIRLQNYLIIFLVLCGVILAMPDNAEAFWPFDSFLKTNPTENQTKFPTVIQRLVDKFKLNSAEVERVVEEVQNERQQEMRARRDAKLGEAVNGGIITQEQKNTLLDKEDEWRQKQTQLMQERQQWMSQSGIDFEKLMPYGTGGGFGKQGFKRYPFR